MWHADSRALVVNFNAPELHHLARALAAAGRLAAYVRPYANKGRLWERWLEQAPLLGRFYAGTLGRRRLHDPRLAALTHEAGVVADLMQAAAMRLPALPGSWRRRLSNELHKSVRRSVSSAGAGPAASAGLVVAYEGFALPAFEALGDLGHRVLSYPVAHHRHRRAVREEELEREPAFASTWPGFEDWPAGHEQRLDAEIASAERILVGSDYVAETFVRQGVAAEKLAVVPYGVDLETFHAPVGPRATGDDRLFRVIYAGQLTQRKGLSYLLRAWQRFRRADAELTLVGLPIGGWGALRPYEGLFRHVPHQTRPALAERYRASDVFVLPTLIEGMPLVVVEAMACGLPVIVTANGPAGIVRDGVEGFIVAERDEAAICRALEVLHGDRERCREMGRNAARRARDFSWSAYTAGVQRVLDALVAG